MSRELQTMNTSASRYNLTYSAAQQEFVTMMVGKQLFGISVMAVQDVLRRQRIFKVPLTPKVIAGSLNLRGRIVTAIDMRVRLGLDAFTDYTQAMNVVVEYRGELYSLLVDKVGEVLSLPLDKLEKSPANVADSWRSLSLGVYKLEKELLVILDVENIVGLGRSKTVHLVDVE